MASGKYQKWIESDNLIRLEAWARNGLTDAQIAHNMGISIATLYNWKRDHLVILESLKKGKEVVDIIVENALLKRAIGYTYEEVKCKYEMGALTEKTVTKKEVIPDVGAQAFWLKNRKPEDWRDKREVDSHVEFESDGFIEALKGQAQETFKGASAIVEEEVQDDGQ